MTDDKEEHLLEEPLMLKEKMEERGLGWLGSRSAEIYHSKSQRKLMFWFTTILPWVLFALLGSWDLIQHRKRLVSINFDPSQQVYS